MKILYFGFLGFSSLGILCSWNIEIMDFFNNSTHIIHISFFALTANTRFIINTFICQIFSQHTYSKLNLTFCSLFLSGKSENSVWPSWNIANRPQSRSDFKRPIWSKSLTGHFCLFFVLKKEKTSGKDSIISKWGPSADSAKSKHDLHVMKSPEKEIGIGNQTIKFPFVFVRNS